ncbi:MAG: hypothetical protein KDC87_07180 [Planctomycetes bacterium]|nr:hypothetical protein [Planctomycetota bacterium]
MTELLRSRKVAAGFDERIRSSTGVHPAFGQNQPWSLPATTLHDLATLLRIGPRVTMLGFALLEMRIRRPTAWRLARSDTRRQAAW